MTTTRLCAALGVTLIGCASSADAAAPRWYENEGIKEAVIDRSMCEGIQQFFIRSPPWNLKGGPSQGYFGEIYPSVINKTYPVEKHTLTRADIDFISQRLLLLRASSWEIPWYADAATVIGNLPTSVTGPLTVAGILGELTNTPSGIASGGFVSELMRAGGGELKYALRFETDAAGHTRATRMYTFATEINRKPMEYVLCVYWIPMNVLQASVTPSAPPIADQGKRNEAGLR